MQANTRVGQSGTWLKLPNQTISDSRVRTKGASMLQHLMPEVQGQDNRTKHRLITVVPFLLTWLFFIVLVGTSTVLERRAMLAAPRVDISEVPTRCGQAVEVAGWVRATGDGYYIVSREAPSSHLTLQDPEYTVSAWVYVLADSGGVRKRSSPEVGTGVSVRGVVACDPEGAIQLEENQLMASGKP